jgi:hypothetical protein
MSQRGGLQKDVYLGWPIAPSYMSPNAGEGGAEDAGYQSMSTAVQRSPNKLWRSNSIFNLWLRLREMNGSVEWVREIIILGRYWVYWVYNVVAEPGCSSRFSNKNFFQSGSRISDATTTKRRRGKKLVVYLTFPNIENYKKILNSYGTGTERDLSNFIIFNPKKYRMDPGRSFEGSGTQESNKLNKNLLNSYLTLT